ncbi:MAG TPA: squalene/phytoene synthase family protein [Acidobacteriota bacterium]|nr:squalene/phytoene synthase family protein [Acidobacteriota bacterium]
MDRIEDLLEKTSRTFALSIPMLPEPTRRELGIAYLLFRIADTFEDASEWDRQQRIDALEEFMSLVREPDEQRAGELGHRWEASVPIDHPGYLELLGESAAVIREYQRLRPAARAIIREHTLRTAAGMSGFVNRSVDGVLKLDSLDDLREYCYVVAGIVGELSTDLFVLGRPQLASSVEFLRQRAARFGEALQLVNILKDAASDRREGRRYLPTALKRREIFLLARKDLIVAAHYTNALQAANAPRGIVAFCALPTRLAVVALALVERCGPGAKISREDVSEIVEAMNLDLDAGAPAVEVPTTARST